MSFFKKGGISELARTKVAVSKTPKARVASSGRSRPRPPVLTDDSLSRASEPSTMEELLAQTGVVLRGARRGQTIEAVVVEVAPKALYLDFGAKTYGLVTGREYEGARSYIRALKVGDKISATVSSPESDSGYILVSLKKMASEQKWNELEEKAGSGEPVSVKVKEANRGGLLVEADGIIGFLPGSQVGKVYSGKMEGLVGKNLSVMVMEADRLVNRLIVSEKAISEAEDVEARRRLLSLVTIGEIYEGEVAGVVPFGIFVKIPVKKEKLVSSPTGSGTLEEVVLEGLVHISEISWEKVDEPKNHYKDGDKIGVKVIGTDEGSARLALSIKQLTDDPWQNLMKSYPAGKKIDGIVRRLVDYGAFVEIEKGIEGLIHISKIPVERNINVGDKVACFIESVDNDNKRISLEFVLSSKPVGYK